MNHPIRGQKQAMVGCTTQLVAMLSLLAMLAFGARHGGRADGSMGPNNRPAESAGGCAWALIPLFAVGLLALSGVGAVLVHIVA